MRILLCSCFVVILIAYTSAAPTKSKEKVADETKRSDDTTISGNEKIKEQTTTEPVTTNTEYVPTDIVFESGNVEIPYTTTEDGLNLGKLPLSKLWTPYGIMTPKNGMTGLPVRVRGHNKDTFSMMRPRHMPRLKKNSMVPTSQEKAGGSEGNFSEVVSRNETHIKELKTRKEKTKASWTTTLANGESLKENVVLSRGSNVMMLRSKTDKYKALTIIDFNSKIHAIKLKIKKAEKDDEEEEKEEEVKVEEEKVERKQNFSILSKIRRLRHRHRHSKTKKNHREICFITDADVDLDEVYMEINAREKNETVQTGNAHVFYVNGDDNVSKGEMKKMGFWIKTFCKKAAAAGKVYNLVSESTAEMNPEPLVVMGQIDASQKGKSVPYHISLESSIEFHS